jgi:hypothetical protein
MGRCACAAIGVLTIALMGCRTAAPVTPVKASFYKVDTFTGSSLGEDAHIYAARRKGIGEVYATLQTFGPGAELIVRSHPRQDAPVVAYLDYEFSADGGWEIAFKAREPGLREEITRVSHEDYGLVVVSIRGGWAQAVYGYHLTGEVRFGWVQLVPDRIVFVSYDANSGNTTFTSRILDAPRCSTVNHSLPGSRRRAIIHTTRAKDSSRTNPKERHPCARVSFQPRSFRSWPARLPL